MNQADPSLRAVGALALALCTFGFSMTGVWVRWLIALDPLAVTAGRVAVAFCVLVPAILLSPSERISARAHIGDVRIHALAIRMTLFFVAAVAAFQVAPVSLVVMFVGVAPAWVLVFERVAGGTVPPARILGVGLALTGAAIGLLPSVFAALGGNADALPVALGAFGGLLAGFFNASYVFRRSRLAAEGTRPGAFVLAALTAAWGIGLYAVTPFTQLGTVFPSTGFEWGALVGLGVISTAATLWGLATASRLMPPLLVALLGPVLPFTAALAAWGFLGETPPLAFAIGAPFVVAGIALLSRPISPPPDQEQPQG